MTTGVNLDPDREPITVYGDVAPRKPAPPAINCRTCTQAGWGTCMLKPGDCESGSKYVAAPVLRFWRQS